MRQAHFYFLPGKSSKKWSLKAFFLEIVDDQLTVAAFVFEGFLAFAFFLVFFLAFNAQACERKDF